MYLKKEERKVDQNPVVQMQKHIGAVTMSFSDRMGFPQQQHFYDAFKYIWYAGLSKWFKPFLIPKFLHIL